MIAPQRVDGDLLWRLFERFVAADTSVRIGETRLEPHDRRLAAFASEVAAPVLAELGAEVEVDGLDNVLARFGPETGRELLLVSYPAVHHGNEMAEPRRARRRAVSAKGVWVGLGASQGKGGLAAVCAAVALLREEGVEPAGRLAVAVSSEGGSSHRSSESLFARFGRLPTGGVLAMGTENRISLGNRGRVDVVVTVHGEATHSSAPARGANPIPLVGEVQARLARLRMDDEPHEALGRRSLVAYRLVCGPVAPHTIPAWCELALDRRLLPGDDAAGAVDEVARALDGLPVSVAAGPAMLPALVDESAEVVRALQAGARLAVGRPLETYYRTDTFDAGYACSLGVPAVMFGPSSSDFGGPAVLGEDAVSERRLREAAAVYAAAVAAPR